MLWLAQSKSSYPAHACTGQAQTHLNGATVRSTQCLSSTTKINTRSHLPLRRWRFACRVCASAVSLSAPVWSVLRLRRLLAGLPPPLRSLSYTDTETRQGIAFDVRSAYLNHGPVIPLTLLTMTSAWSAVKRPCVKSVAVRLSKKLKFTLFSNSIRNIYIT